MKAHIARNQNAGIPLALGWNLSAADRGILEGMAPAFGMKLQLVSPADAGRTVAQLLGEVEVKTTRTLVLEPGAYPPAVWCCPLEGVIAGDLLSSVFMTALHSSPDNR